MHKKFLLLFSILLLTSGVALTAVNFSYATKAEYQRRYNNLLNKAATYTTISAADRALYQQQMNDGLNQIEKMINDPNIPDEMKKTMLNALNDSLSSMEQELNNPNISAAQKIAGIKQTLQSMKTGSVEQQSSKQEQEWREKRQAGQAKREETWQKAQAEQQQRLETLQKALAENKKSQEQAQTLRNKALEWKKRHDALVAAKQSTICNIAVVPNAGAAGPGLCFAGREKAYLTYHDKISNPDDDWEEADYACKLQDMRLPSREQWKRLIDINEYLAYPFDSLDRYWSSERIDSNSAYAINPIKNIWSTARRDDGFVQDICVKEFQNYQEITKK